MTDETMSPLRRRMIEDMTGPSRGGGSAAIIPASVIGRAPASGVPNACPYATCRTHAQRGGSMLS
jgi:hypothetical protein